MDTPITEKQPNALQRVWGAIKASAHQVDASDVREALNELQDELNCWGSDLEKSRAHIGDLETQLFHYRVNAGGSEALLGGAIKTRDRLVDYFRYVEKSVPFAKTAEARERGTAIVDGMNWLIREAGNIRLAVQAVKAQRNQLEAELSEARMALDASQGQVRQMEAEAEELRGLADRQAGLLSRTAIAIRGPEPDLTRWSHHDLPELAAAMRKQRDICASAANKIQWATPDYAHQEGVCPECGQYEHDGHSEGCMVGRACGIYDVLRFTGALK